MRNVTSEDIPAVLRGLVFHVFARESVFSLLVAANKVIKDKAAYLDHFVLVTHLKRRDASVQQWESDRCEKFGPNRHKDIPTAVIRGVRENGIGWGAVDQYQIVLLLNLGYEARQQSLLTSRISKRPGQLEAGGNKIEEATIRVSDAIVDDF